MATDKQKLEDALGFIAKALGEKGGDFAQKVEASLQMLDAALGCLSKEGLLARASVEVQADTRTGKRYTCKYSLGAKVENGREVPYLKKSELEEDE